MGGDHDVYSLPSPAFRGVAGETAASAGDPGAFWGLRIHPPNICHFCRGGVRSNVRFLLGILLLKAKNPKFSNTARSYEAHFEFVVCRRYCAGETPMILRN